MGTASGAVLSLVCDEKDKKERGPKVVLEMAAPGSIKGLALLPLPKGGLLLLLSTPTHLCVFQGPTESLEALGGAYQGSSGGLLLLLEAHNLDSKVTRSLGDFIRG